MPGSQLLGLPGLERGSSTEPPLQVPGGVDRCLEAGGGPEATPPRCLTVLASTEIPETNVTKVKLKCFVIVSFIFLFFFTY